MRNSIYDLVSRLMLPGFLIGAIIWLVGHPDIHPPLLPKVLDSALYAAAILGAAFCWWFNRTNAIFALVQLAAIHWMMSEGIGVPPVRDAWLNVVYPALALLVSFNFVWLAFFEERGFVTPSGLMRMAFLGTQAIVVAALAFGQNGAFAREAAYWLHWRSFDKSFDLWTHLPQPALIAFALVAVVISAKFIRKPTVMDGAWLGALVCVFLALHHLGQPIASGLYIAGAMAVMIVCVIHDSYRMAFLDELTGLPGRRALMADLKKLGSRYVLAMGDIDHFKKFNDTHGHDVGDDVLRMVARQLARVRGGGKAYRYGGEEFTIVFPRKNLEGAKPYLEEVRKLVESSDFTIRDQSSRPQKLPWRKRLSRWLDHKPAATKTVHVTVSLGAALKTKDHSDAMAVMKSADQALYRAKEGGRNQVAF